VIVRVKHALAADSGADDSISLADDSTKIKPWRG
jgi:hypothetical protein